MDIYSNKQLCYCEIRALSGLYKKKFNGTKKMFKINIKINIVLVLILLIGFIEISEGNWLHLNIFFFIQ